MAEAVAEKPANGTAEKATEVGNDNANTKVSASKDEQQADAEDEHEQYGSSKRENRDKDRGDYKKNDRNEENNRGRRNDGGRGGRGRGGRGGFSERGGRGRGRGGGRGGYQKNYNRSDNVRTEFSRKEESSDATEIRRQVEFYFSDSNLPIDKFLLEATEGPKNVPFPLRTIHNFKRMRHFQPFSLIVDAVKNSKFLEVNDRNEVYRKYPLDSKFGLDPYENEKLLTSDTMLRSIYAKGFGHEGTNTAFEIESYFEPYGATSVRMRREKDGYFKGSVFVEFESQELAEQFLNLEERPGFGEHGIKLTVKSKKDYVDQKSMDILDGKVKPKSPTRYGGRNHRGGFDGGRGGKRKRSYDDSGFDSNDWRARRDHFQAWDSSERKPMSTNPADYDTDIAKAEEEKAKTAETAEAAKEKNGAAESKDDGAKAEEVNANDNTDAKADDGKTATTGEAKTADADTAKAEATA